MRPINHKQRQSSEIPFLLPPAPHGCFNNTDNTLDSGGGPAGAEPRELLALYREHWINFSLLFFLALAALKAADF
jgi:hypothetical protein